MIVVEGPDGSGKTTLVKQLAEHFQLPVAKGVVEKNTHAMTDLKEWTDQNLEKGFQKVIFDRHRLVSAPIYDAVLRKGSGLDDTIWLRAKYAQWFAIAPLVIYCLPPLAIVEENISRDNDNEAVADQIDHLWRGYNYRATMDAAMGLGLIYDYTQWRTPRVPFSAVERRLGMVGA